MIKKRRKSKKKILQEAVKQEKEDDRSEIESENKANKATRKWNSEKG